MTKEELLSLLRVCGADPSAIDAVELAFEAGRQQGIKQERALWELARIDQDDDDTMCYRSELDAAVRSMRGACAALLEENAMACQNPIHRSLLQANAEAIRAMGQKPKGENDD